jgi:hypothetical protein
MSAVDYTRVGTDELIQRFAETAKRAGSLWNDSLALTLTPEREQAAKDMQPIGAELRARKPTAKLRQLFEDKSPDVRCWAAGQFFDIDFEWALATLSGLNENITTREVLVLRQRVLEGPPPEPSVREMTIDQMVDCFKDACARCYATTRFLTEEEGGGNTMIAYNHISGELYSIAEELNTRGKLDALVPLLDDPLITVRQKAATYCLPVATDRALTALEAIDATRTWPENIFAGATLSKWQSGTYRPFVSGDQGLVNL